MSYNNSIVRIIEAESYQQRLERKLEYQDKNHKYPNVEAVITRPEGSHFVNLHYLGSNIVTDDGDIFYAKKGAGETPASNENFAAGRFELRTGSATPAKTDSYDEVTTPVTASRKVFDATYPKTNDTGDADNTGDGVKVVSYRTSWTTTDFNATAIIGGCVHDNASPVGATKLLTHFSITSFDKTASDTLKLFLNHAMAGV